ncbi:MAG: hypothetical protein P8X96_13505, partial [Desulfobacteraceae bacterium]
ESPLQPSSIKNNAFFMKGTVDSPKHNKTQKRTKAHLTHRKLFWLRHPGGNRPITMEYFYEFLLD